jgi:hypothetical protein
VYDICHPESPQDARPYLLPRPADTSWKPHEVEYLRHQGVFDILPSDICNDLIRCYFHHVNFLPIVDAAAFLTEYETNGRHNISLLLFWSMLLAAANVSHSPFLVLETYFTNFEPFPSLLNQMSCKNLGFLPVKR